jgi:hypothetical protein
MIVNGKADMSGFTSIAMDLGSRQIQGYLYENKAYVICAQRNWSSEPLLRKDETPSEFMGRLIRGFVPPVSELGLILKNGDKLKRNGDVFSGDLPPTIARKLLDQGVKRVSKTKRKDSSGTGTAKIWTQDGAVRKYEIKLHGKVDIDGQETEVDRTRTVEITDVGGTVVTLPDSVRRNLKWTNGYNRKREPFIRVPP